MKADIRRWDDLAGMEDPSGLVVLHDGGMMTIRTISEDLERSRTRVPAYRVSCMAPWGGIVPFFVKGDRWVAVIEREAT